MIRKLAGYGAGLIALYILVANGSKAGQLFKDSGTGGRTLVTALQGR